MAPGIIPSQPRPTSGICNSLYACKINIQSKNAISKRGLPEIVVLAASAIYVCCIRIQVFVQCLLLRRIYLARLICLVSGSFPIAELTVFCLVRAARSRSQSQITLKGAALRAGGNKASHPQIYISVAEEHRLRRPAKHRVYSGTVNSHISGTVADFVLTVARKCSCIAEQIGFRVHLSQRYL